MKRKRNLLVLMDVDTEKVFPFFLCSMFLGRTHSHIYIFICVKARVNMCVSDKHSS